MAHSAPQRRTTVHDIAAAAGVSRGTVSRALNGGYVSAAARAAIEEAIAGIGFVPNTAARTLRTSRSQAVAFVALGQHAGAFADPNIGAVMLAANAVLSGADHQMVNLLLESSRDTERVARHLSGGFVDGAIVVSARAGDPIIKVIRDLRLPAAVVGHPPDLDDAVPYVGIDNRNAAHEIVSRLLATGRRRTGMIAAAQDRDSCTDRLAGYRSALGPAFEERLVVRVPGHDHRSGAEGMRLLLEREPAIDGVFAASDVLAAGALEALREAGRSVPGDVGVVGFDDSPWAVWVQPRLSTVRQPIEEIGSAAAHLVLRQLRGEPVDPGGRILPTTTVWRDSA
ncbi:LacI family DNA-binding transcriptional regulator [Actinoplanes philippinensis]|uniref:LacI family DNA-binding transcriptional regulator n=1 Tax=Actinoplanes philippinensis TaxID=35752 RepID=UPI0033FA4AE8